MGPAICIRLSELTTPQVVQVSDLVKYDGDTADRIQNTHYIKAKSRPQHHAHSDSTSLSCDLRFHEMCAVHVPTT